MNIGLSTQYDTGSTYTIKLNEKEVLEISEDKSRVTGIESVKKKKLEESKEAEKKASTNTDNLSPDEQRLVKDLAARDSEVKAHESAHQAAGGGMTGAASYTYQQGPDGKMYAIGGEVSISTPAASTPEEAIANARQVMASAMAAGNPSPQDFAVASSARVMEMKAMQQLAKEQAEESLGKETYKNNSSPTDKNDKVSFQPFDISA